VSLLSLLLTEAGIEPNASRATAAGKFFAAEGVWRGPEFDRIKALPRRRWQDAPDLERLTELLSKRLRRREGPRLLQWQAAALRELNDYGRLYVVGSVGQGKTLITALAPVIRKAKRPLFVTYKNLLDKTRLEFRELAEDWNICQNYEFISCEKLSRAESADFLDKLQPDMVVWDESAAAKSIKSGRTRRMGRFLKAHPECTFVPLTGTPGDTSLSEYAHLLEWALGPENTPLPASWVEFQQWQQALDVNVPNRRAPGVLTDFSYGNEDLQAVREGVGRRIEETPGVIYSRSASVDIPLVLQSIVYDGPAPVLEYVRRSGDELPDGRVIETPLERYRLFQTLNLGFARVIDPPPPKDWRDARKEWSGFVTDILSQSKYALDTPDQVKRLCESGELDSYGVYEAWKEIKPSFTIVSHVEWFDDGALEFVAEWAAANDGLVWVPFPAFAERLAKLSGLPYFHEGGFCDALGMSVEEYGRKYGGKSVIVSTQANDKGRNLQAWNLNLVVGVSGKADQQEQQLGRTHRRGQTRPVEVQYLIASIENLESLYKARERAEHDRDTGRNESGKLLSGTWEVLGWDEVSRLEGPRWKK
jgi:hypothetical protein